MTKKSFDTIRQASRSRNIPTSKPSNYDQEVTIRLRMIEAQKASERRKFRALCILGGVQKGLIEVALEALMEGRKVGMGFGHDAQILREAATAAGLQ